MLLICCLLSFCSCRFPGSVKPTVKIGLSAPFEGRDRDLGYAVLHAVRLAVRQCNDRGGLGGRYLVEFVALNDYGEPEEAILQARKMAVDLDVLGVLGGWSPETAQAAAPVYEQLGLAFLTANTDWLTGAPPSSPATDTSWFADYRVLSGGAPPPPAAWWAYAETNRLLDAMDTVTRLDGQATRANVLRALGQDGK